MNNLKFEFINDNDIVISTYYKYLMNDVKHIKSCYFTDGKSYYGVNNKLQFFINNNIFDFKLKQEINSYFQFKTIHHDLLNDFDNMSYNVGINTNDNKYQYRYTMVIFNDIKIICQKYDNDKLINEKIVNI
jgi:hypothetical protein